METKRRFVAISAPELCGMQCLGVFDDYRTAIGEVMVSVWEQKDCYQDEGDVFEYTEFEPMEGEGGFVMEVKYKDACWEKAFTDYYYILFDENDESA